MSKRRKREKRKDKKKKRKGDRYRGGDGRLVTYTQTQLDEILSRKADMSKVVLMKESRDNKTTVTGYPSIKITEKALIDLSVLVSLVETEVGWYGMVQWTPENDLLITEILVPTQQCHGATTEISGAGLAELCEEMMAKEAEEGITLDKSRVHSIRYWGHSHVNMGVTASGQDDKQMLEYGDAGVDMMIRGIHNKRGDTQFDVYYYRNGKVFMHFKDVPWEVVEESDRFKEVVTSMQEVVKARVSTITTQVHTGYAYGGRHYGGVVVTPHPQGSWTPHVVDQQRIPHTQIPSGGSQFQPRGGDWDGLD
jgi:hypothetical protein